MKNDEMKKRLFAARYGFTPEQLAEIGLEIVECTCGMHHCSGYQFEKRPNFKIRHFAKALRYAD